MIALLWFLLTLFASPLKSRSRLEAENAALRYQLIVLRRKVRGRIRLTNGDRLVFIQLYRWFPSVLKVITVFRPETLVRWHRAGFRCYWRWKSRSRGGRPKIEADLCVLIRRMNRENPLWGAPRIHGELLKLGFQVAQSTVAKYMAKSGRGRSQTWKTFLRNHAPDIAAINLFVVPTIGFKLLYGIVIMRLDRRRLLWTDVTTNPTAEWIAADYRGICFGIATDLTVQSSVADCTPWASVTTRPRHARRGRMAMLNGSSDRSGTSASTTLWSWAKPPCAALSKHTPATTTRSELTGRCIRMRRRLVRLSSPDRSSHAPCLADFTITTFGFRFSVHTRGLTDAIGQSAA